MHEWCSKDRPLHFGDSFMQSILILEKKCLQEFFFFKKELHFIGPKVSYPTIYSIVLALSINRPMFFTSNIQPPPPPPPLPSKENEKRQGEWGGH